MPASPAKKNGDAYAWGDAGYGGTAPSLTNVADISCGKNACVARKHNGDAYAWGRLDASSVDLTGVADISCGKNACVARKNDGTVEAWGHPDWGGNAPSLTNVADISCGGYACVARKHDGTAVAWGDASVGGDASSVDLNLKVVDASDPLDLGFTCSPATTAQLRMAMNDQNC